MQKHRSELATVNVTIKLVGLLNKAKNKGCLVVLHRLPLIFENWKKVFLLYKSIPPLIFRIPKKVFTVQKYTAPNFQNSKKVFTVQKYTAPNFQNSKKVFFSLRILIL